MFYLQRMLLLTGHQWLMPIILPIWEAEIRRITVQGQTWQIVFKTPISKNNQSKMDCVAEVRVPAF
jgi:hypothetical protein